MSKVKELVQTMLPEQQAAIAIIETALDCYNSKDGSGLFAGVERYTVLERRVQVSAIQARSLTEYWAKLLHNMMWGIPKKQYDQQIIEVLSAENPTAVLRVLATEAAATIQIARMLHSSKKPEYKKPADMSDIESDALS